MVTIAWVVVQVDHYLKGNSSCSHIQMSLSPTLTLKGNSK